MQLDLDRLRSFVLDSGMISKEDLLRLEESAKKGGRTLSEELVSSGLIPENNFRKIEAYVLGVPFVDLSVYKIPFSTLSLVPEPIARRYNIVIYKESEAGLEAAMLDPNDLGAIDFIAKKTGKRIVPRLTDSQSIKSALLQYQKSLKVEFGEIIQKEGAQLKTVREDSGEGKGVEDLAKMAEDLPIVKIVDTLMNHAILQSASDVHIEPGQDALSVRYRIDGILHDAMMLPKEAASGVVARIKVLAGLRLDEKRLPQDGRFKIERPEELDKVSVRVSVLPIFYGEKVVMRLLVESSKGFTLEALGFHGESLERIHSSLRKTTGIILTTGPTGSGKTTTLYTILDQVNTPKVNISTIEDPIEYQMPRVNQTQVKPEIGLTFATGLRALLRQDPNIIMVGEIRDKETAGLAVNAALTGHLVLSTLHTNSASGSFPRLLDMGVEPFLLVSTVQIVIAQRLVRRLAGEKEKYQLSKEDIVRIAKHADMVRVLQALKTEKKIHPDDTWESITFFHPKESKDFPDGYHGRVTIGEVLVMSPIIRELIMKGATAKDVESAGRKDGMLTMFEDGLFQAACGVTSLEECFRVAEE